MNGTLPRLLAALTALVLLTACTTGAGGDAAPVQLRWYCCLGTGEQADQVKAQQAVVDEFNARHRDIKVKLDVVPYNSARDTLATQIASGKGPDIVGPVGVGGAAAFHGQWLDLGPFIKARGFDLRPYSEGAADLYRIGSVQEGLPFAIYPSTLYYKADLFEEAGLAEPPHKYGEKYRWPDGREAEWNYETLRELALRLTVDKNGKDATQQGFDAGNIVQYGFEPARDDLRYQGSAFGPASLDAGDGKTVKIPEPWADAWRFFYDGMWKDRFIMTGPVFETDRFNGDGAAFFSGHVAMSVNFLWSTYGVAGAGPDWDVAAMPSHDGRTTSPTSADTFRILAGSKHPDKAFEFLSHLVGPASNKLLEAYGAMPARTADQDAFFTKLAAQFTNTVDWQVAKDSVRFADTPHSEAHTPKYNQTLAVLGTYRSRWMTKGGLDMDAELTRLRAEIQKIWDR
ncbi:sugar ABC transporter substrate-binding protein [Spongiactinospora gelatinilytica]|uniref:Sugar ABC transporter substrate-binding protein n=1 Tax=Spongiactinospora gelatinilytica TaxID=2666298 RepID=A0A2W2H2U3_9ACTN|nr:extracellular solute-binding protein [Spongiactinospora gelatinilytica]PZG54253.1 sugar ABC transporter substrate-binding protein [Spongiactinospora gelatinilytica]